MLEFAGGPFLSPQFRYGRSQKPLLSSKNGQLFEPKSDLQVAGTLYYDTVPSEFSPVLVSIFDIQICTFFCAFNLFQFEILLSKN